MGLLGWLGLGLAGLWYFRKSKAANVLQFFPAGLEISKGKVYFVMEIVNPTKEELTFDNVFATIGYENLKIGRIEYVERTTIRPQGTTVVKFLIKVVFLDLGTFLAKVYKGEVKTVQVFGTINSMGFNVPFKAEIPISIV